MQLPRLLLDSLESVKGFDKQAFEKVHASGEQITSIRINPNKDSKFQIPNSNIPWCETGYYLDSRPSFTFDPLFHAGCYYVQEASSMFLEQALKQTVDLLQPLKVLDLCAAPGGKSTHIQSLISKESLLVSNEVIRSRANILKDNSIRWGCNNVVVTNNDPKDFTKLENYFDAIVVDAPCSGSGLFRRDEDAIAEWSLNNVALCSHRQQRILADILPALKKNGVLIYSTCSYSKEEDEDIMDWMKEEMSVVSCPLSVHKDWNVTEVTGSSGAFGYRFWPDKIKGEGFFMTCFRKLDGEFDSLLKKKNKRTGLTKGERDIVEKWVKTDGLHFIKYEDTVYAWPDHLAAYFNLLLTQFRVIYSGTLIGELMGDKLIPHHALALSSLVNETIIRTELNYEQAIEYLQRKDLKIQNAERGWRLVAFKGKNIGWINVLPGRINNYYPKELRILKES